MGNNMQTWARVLGLGALLCWPMHGAAQTSSAVDTQSQDSAPHHVNDSFSLGVFGGVMVPRGSLGLAPTVGIAVSYAVTDEVRFIGTVDWALLSLQQSRLLSPPQYPRSQGELIQNTHAVTMSLAAGYKLLALGEGELVAALGLLLSVTSTRFEVYDTVHRDGDVGPGVEAQLVLSEPIGPLRLRVHVAYREVLHNLGASGQFGEDVLSGLVAGAGLLVAF